MKLKHTQKKSANRNFDKNTHPKGWHPNTVEKHFSPKQNSKTQIIKRQKVTSPQ